MMRRFCEQFDELGVPYWAALHAPGMKNDSRNFHCHIAYSERPAKRIVDPADGTKKWDFEIVARRRKPSGDLQPPTRPHRQKKHDFFRPRDAIRMMRERMAAAANEILSADDVRDSKGEPVRYDPRSYADMGLDVVPIRSISRIVADKMRAGKITVLDPVYTRRQIEAQIREAAAAREPQVLELLQLDQALEAMTKRPATAHRENGRLPKDLWVSPLAMLSGTAVRVAGQRMMRARREALIVDIMERSTVDALSAMARATDPAVVETARKNTRDPVRLAALPDLVAARRLHQGALAMIEEARAEARERRRTARYRIGATAQAWRDLVGPIDLSPTPATRIAIERMQEERPTGAWEESRGPETDGGRAGPARARATTAITVERTESGRTETARAAAAPPPADQRPSHRGAAKHPPSPDSGSRTQPPGAAGVARPAGLTAAPPARSGQAGVVQGSGQRPGLVPAALAIAASAAASDMINRLRGEVEPDNALAALKAFLDGLRAQQAAKKQALEGMQAALAARLQAAAAARVMGQPSPDAGAAEIGAAPGEAAARGGLANSLATEAGAERTVRRGEAPEPARPMEMQPRPEVGAARSNEGGPGVARRSVAEPAIPRAVAPPEITASADVTAGSPVGRLDPASATAAGQAAAPSPPEAIPGPAVDKPRRRKRTKEEEEREKKRKAQRQAVLAKRNKGRGR